MKRVFLGLFLVSVSTAARAADDDLAAAFTAAFGKNKGSVVLKKQGPAKENIRYVPGDLVDTSFGPVLLSPGEVLEPSHANSGKLAVHYLARAPKGFTVTKKFVPAVQTGAFGKIVDWSVSKSFGPLPIVTVNGADNWQGYMCSSMTMVELTPDGPRHLVTVPMTYDNSGAGGKKVLQANGRIEKIVPGRSFDVVYFGSKDFTERYVRKGDTYVLDKGAKSKMERC
jgi:hypothetical protein